MRLLYAPNNYTGQRQFEKPVWIYPAHLAMEAQYHRDRGVDVDWGEPKPGVTYTRTITKPEGLPFLELPYPDRIWSDAFDKRYQRYGNYKFRPATHTQFANLCWYQKCEFCVESHSKWERATRPVDHCVKELKECEALGFREVFDDSGTFPVGEWLDRFCTEKWLFAPDIRIGINMRVGAEVDPHRMKRANFRMILIGVESAHQTTLNKLRKGTNAKDTIPFFKSLSDAGLEPHIAFMCGFPWESEAEERQTFELVYYLLRKGYARTAQASVYTTTYATPDGVRGREPKQSVYDVAKYPDFWYHQIRGIKCWEDFTYLLRGIRKGIVRD